MFRKVRFLSRHSRGTVSIELAMILPAFLALVLAVAEVGRFLWTQDNLRHALDQAGRYAMINPTATTSDVTAYAGTQLIEINPADVTFAADTLVSSGINKMSITASYDFQFIFGILPFTSRTITVSTEVSQL